ncbi:MAG: hypothetical protein HC804_00005 [Anaerolineae bacterium]|nr:hypothetical protein [Anaerolineae bacterium]
MGWQITPGSPLLDCDDPAYCGGPRSAAGGAHWLATGHWHGFGVAIAAAVLSINLPQITLLLLWLLVTLIMLAVQDVNYLLYASILTLNLLLFYQLLEADVLFNGMERLVTTLLGIAFAMGIIVLLEYLAKRPSREPSVG